MQIIQAPRASAILYSLLKSQGNSNPWLLPANICPIVPITFFKAGVPFELVDISAETLHMDLEQAWGRLERGPYGGVLYAHTYGELSTPEEFFQQVKSRFPDLLLLDDRCLCIPDFDPPQNTHADVALYSTGYAKIVELNFGGYAYLKEDIRYQAQPLPFNQQALDEIERNYKHALESQTPYNYKDSDWLHTVADLPEWYDYCREVEARLKPALAQRAAINEIYARALPAEIQLPAEYQTWRFNLRVKNKGRVLKAIFAAGLFASSHYASLAGIMAPGRSPQAQVLSEEVINLFNDQHFDSERADRVCSVIMENIK